MSKKDYIKIQTELLQTVTTEQAWHYAIIPKNNTNNKILEFYIDQNKCNPSIKEELEIILAKEILLYPIETDIINKTLGKYYIRSEQKKQNISVNWSRSDNFLEFIINEANSINCSDIHIETYEKRCRIRLRIDGKLVERYTVDRSEYPALVNKIKIKANLDIAEKRLPQDGRIFFELKNSTFDIRVSVLPTLHGEKIVLRLLSKDATDINIEKLGFSKQQLKNYLEAAKKSYGIILISGPTGSGKTTTLYATLKVLNKENTNILTIEDPIEYTLEGINQVQLKEKIGLTFAHALRTFLRQDPDIIMLGEIRDPETANMAIRAALTGHLVLSTVHTNTAWGTVSRLVDMGVPPFLLASTLNLTVSQRLVRLLCPDCKQETEFSKDLYPKHFDPPTELNTHQKATGCINCFYTGYKGRKAVYEVIPIDTEIEKHIKNTEFNINNLLSEKGIKRIWQSAFELFKNGSTTIEEIYPILMNQD